MKKNVVIGMVLIGCMTSAIADRDRFNRRDDYNRRPHPDAHWHDDAGWLVPALIGGILVYGAMNSQSNTQQPQQPSYAVTPGQQQTPPPGFHWEQIADANCNCYRMVLVKD